MNYDISKILTKSLIKDISFIKIIKYLLVGGSSAIIEFLIYLACLKIIGLYYLFSNIIAIFCVLFYGFFMQKYWTFKNREKINKQFIKFTILVIAIFFINNFLIWFFVEIAKINLIFSKIFQLFISTFINFMVQNFIVFK